MKSALAALLVLVSLAHPCLADAVRFVALSDPHFNPADSGITAELDAAPLERWADLLDSARPGRNDSVRYGADSPWELVRSALDQARSVTPDAAFVVVTGDLLAHQFYLRYKMALPLAGDTRYAAFARKTFTFVLTETAKRFPGRPIYFSLGNNDDECGDYKVTPDGPFLEATLPLVRQLAGVPEDDAAFAQAWAEGSGYEAVNPAVPKIHMLSVNTVYFSRNYKDSCAKAASVADPGMRALDWLESRLQAASLAGEKVWLLLHIPPGGDAYADLSRASHCPNGLLPMWKPEYTRRFLDLSERYRGTIAASFAGHTHMDEFRLIGRNGTNVGYSLSTPGISPIFGQNPGFHVYTLGPDGSFADRETWIVSNMRRSKPDQPLAWTREYDFADFWHLPRVDMPSLEGLNARIQNDTAAREGWFSVYRVGNPAMWGVPNVQSLPPDVFRTYTCAIGYVDPAEYARCVCSDGR